MSNANYGYSYLRLHEWFQAQVLEWFDLEILVLSLSRKILPINAC